MKKITKKLALSKITIAPLTTNELTKVAGGRAPNNYTKVSVCAEQCCDSDYCW
jgi:hypothetical protein